MTQAQEVTLAHELEYVHKTHHFFLCPMSNDRGCARHAPPCVFTSASEVSSKNKGHTTPCALPRMHDTELTLAEVHC